jgi:hypothetical protein
MALLKTALRAKESFLADLEPGVFLEPPVETRERREEGAGQRGQRAAAEEGGGRERDLRKESRS